eukprot:8832920-Pyramimonas_sp.AAC.1
MPRRRTRQSPAIRPATRPADKHMWHAGHPQGARQVQRAKYSGSTVPPSLASRRSISESSASTS